MPTFAIYKIMFSPARQRSLLAEDGRTNLDHAQDYMEEVLDEKLHICKELRDKTLLPLDNYVDTRRERVTLMVVCNEKCHKYREKLEDRELVHHPGCHVIIDNRPGVAQLAIERSESFGNNPDRVRDLLQDALCKAFARFEIGVELRAKMRERAFWEMVDDQREQFKDPIKKVVFDFPNPDKVAPVDASAGMLEKLVLLSTLTAATNAAKGTLNLLSDKEKVIELKRSQEDIAHLVEMCAHNGYDIAVHFKHYGVYRFGRSVKALDTIKRDVIQEFRCGQMMMGKAQEGEFLLIAQLDEIRTRTENYVDEEPVEKKRTRGGKK